MSWAGGGGRGAAGRAAPAGSVRREPSVLFRNVRVFDGVASTPARDVLVRGATIVRVDGRVDAEADEVIDGQGKTLLPGLIDAHAHVHEAAQLRRSAVFGVTTVLDMMTDPAVARTLKRRLATPAGRQLADLRSAGNPVTAPKGHGTEYGIPVRTLATPEAAQAFVDACIAEGSDYIKLVHDDGHIYGIRFGDLDDATLAASIAAAHARAKLAVVHIGTQEDARDAIDAGVDGLAHLFVDSAPTPDFAALVAEHHAFVIPTLSVLRSVVGASVGPALARDHELAPYLGDDDVERLERSFPPVKTTGLEYAFAVATVRRLRAAHVPILAGTDAPNPGTSHGASLHEELALLVDAGLTPREALAAATSVPAARFRLTDRGRVAAGLRADLLLVEGDPTADVRALRHIVGVWARGVRIDRAGSRAAIEKERLEARTHEVAAPAGSESGLISDFEGGEPAASFGHGWAISTDAIMGGTSTATMEITRAGADGSKGALTISGAVVAASGGVAWAGAMFSPGTQPMAPADLSSKKELAFWAKGDGRTYVVLLSSKRRGFRPAAQRVAAGPRWQRYTFPLSGFEGLDLHDLTGIFFGAGPPGGPFELQLDRVELR
jgi:imidazolonepropionase-like amidohydrolase